MVHGRSKEKCINTVEEIRKQNNDSKVEYIVGDLSSKEQIENISIEVHKKLNQLDILINNAGILEKKRILQNDQIELTFMVNHLAPMYLTFLLLDLLQTAPQGRIVNVSSQIHASSIDFENLQGEKSYSGTNAYCLSKAGNIFFSNELADRLNNTNITVNSLHPGVINTKLLRKSFGAGGSSVAQGARTSVYLADSNEVSNQTGKYFVNERETAPKTIIYNKDVRKRLWNVSEQLLSIKFSDYWPTKN